MVQDDVQVGESTMALTKFDFHGDQLDVVKDGGRLWVSLRRVCDALGIDTDSQRKKLAEKAWATCTVLSTVQVSTDGTAQERPTFCVDLDCLPMWLATIEPSRVGEHVREKLVRYQRDAAKVLADHFLGRRGGDSEVIGHLCTELETVNGRVLDLGHSIDDLRSENDQLREMLTDSLTSNGLLSPDQRENIKSNVDWIAAERVALGQSKTEASARGWIQGRLQHASGWAGRGTSRENTPSASYAKILVCLNQMKADLKDEAKRQKREQSLLVKQTTLFGMMLTFSVAAKNDSNKDSA